MAKEKSVLDNINDVAKTVTNVKKATKPAKKKKAKKTKATKTKTTKTASAPKAASVSNAAKGPNVVETLRLIETEVENGGDAKAKKLFKKFTKETMKSKPNQKTGNKLMDKMGLLSDASANVKKLIK